jgi:hypothetical protein
LAAKSCQQRSEASSYTSPIIRSGMLGRWLRRLESCAD